jgi:glucan phosphoethanolaminetransferase (alkaline phosphatase superfamily)
MFGWISVSFDPDSKVNDESESQQLKHSEPTISTEEGIQTDFNDEQQEKAFASIRISFESDSKVNDEIEEQ